MPRSCAGLGACMPFHEPAAEIFEDRVRAFQDLSRPARGAFRNGDASLRLRGLRGVPRRAARSVRGAQRAGERLLHFAAPFARAQDGQLALHGDGGNCAVQPCVARDPHQRAPVELEQLLRGHRLELERPGAREEVAQRGEARDPPRPARILRFRITQGFTRLRQAFSARRQLVRAQDAPQGVVERQARGATISLARKRRGEPGGVLSQVRQLEQHELLFT